MSLHWSRQDILSTQTCSCPSSTFVTCKRGFQFKLGDSVKRRLESVKPPDVGITEVFKSNGELKVVEVFKSNGGWNQSTPPRFSRLFDWNQPNSHFLDSSIGISQTPTFSTLRLESVKLPNGSCPSSTFVTSKRVPHSSPAQTSSSPVSLQLVVGEISSQVPHSSPA